MATKDMTVAVTSDVAYLADAEAAPGIRAAVRLRHLLARPGTVEFFLLPAYSPWGIPGVRLMRVRISAVLSLSHCFTSV